eukprot:10222089-Alexandrium_andersonii.AAC.1
MRSLSRKIPRFGAPSCSQNANPWTHGKPSIERCTPAACEAFLKWSSLPSRTMGQYEVLPPTTPTL